jgi:CheY-like chemotaxis protein
MIRNILIDDWILIVDDDFDIASLITISIDKLGVSVTCFADPLEALKEFSSHYLDYNLVISDIRMPHMTGYEFERELKKIKPDVKILLISAFEYSDSYFAEAFSHSEIERFIEKPIALSELRKLVLDHTHNNNNISCPF